MQPQKIPSAVSEPASENLQRLAALFPSIMKDGQVDFEELKAELGTFEEVDKERYELTWAGKQQAKKTAAEGIYGRTLKYVPEDSKNPDTTENLYIEGDNLEVLKLLQNSYMGKIKMIYIDPPYNTGKDFVYRDKFSVSDMENAQAEGDISEYGERYTLNSKSSGKYHANWLSMMYTRLRLAKNLLRDDGAIFISIDDTEIDNLKQICNEIFGSTNFICNFIRKGSGGRQDSTHYAIVHEYIICYAKNSDEYISGKEIKSDNNYPLYDELKGKYYKTQLLRKWGENSRRSDRPNLFYPIPDPDGNDFYPMLSPSEEGCWRWGKTKMFEEIKDGRVEFKKRNNEWIAYEKIFEPVDDTENTKLFSTIIDDIGNSTGAALLKALFNVKIFNYPKPVDLIKKIFLLGDTKDNDIVLDFFSGSATTAHAIMMINSEDGGNRKYIMVQYPEKLDDTEKREKENIHAIDFCNNIGISKTISEIGKERIRRAGEKIKDEAGEKAKDLDIGFRVFKTADTNVRWIAEENGMGVPQTQLGGGTKSSKDRRDFMPDATDIDVAYEILLRQYDIPLSAPMETLSDIGERTYCFADAVVVCLEEELTADIIDKIAAIEPMPHKVVFRDSAFGKDINLKLNTMQRFDAMMKKHGEKSKQPYTVEFL